MIRVNKTTELVAWTLLLVAFVILVLLVGSVPAKGADCPCGVGCKCKPGHCPSKCPAKPAIGEVVVLDDGTVIEWTGRYWLKVGPVIYPNGVFGSVSPAAIYPRVNTLPFFSPCAGGKCPAR